MVVCGTFCDSRENEVLGFAEHRGELPCVHMSCAQVARDMLLFDETACALRLEHCHWGLSNSR
jgi:hypothetical protein